MSPRLHHLELPFGGLQWALERFLKFIPPFLLFPTQFLRDIKVSRHSGFFHFQITCIKITLLKLAQNCCSPNYISSGNFPNLDQLSSSLVSETDILWINFCWSLIKPET